MTEATARCYLLYYIRANYQSSEIKKGCCFKGNGLNILMLRSYSWLCAATYDTGLRQTARKKLLKTRPIRHHLPQALHDLIHIR